MKSPPGADGLLPPGSVIGQRYRVDRPIGSGTAGTVYAALDLSNDRLIAVKVINRSHTDDPTMVARFQREGRIIADLHHPNVVDVFEVSQLDGHWVLTMELLEGTNLADAIDAKGAYELRDAVPILDGVLSALDVAHAQQIIHRDIKPQNIFLAKTDGGHTRVKVLDFGVAKVVGISAEEQLTRSGTILGTPEFMAPEQATGAGAEHRSDLYAVACVAYAMLCGRPPFVDDWAMRIVMKQAFEVPLPPSRLRPQLSRTPGVDGFMKRALEKKPADRYQSASEMRAALAMLVEHTR